MDDVAKIRYRTLEFLTIPVVFNATDPALAQTKVPAGNFPAGFEQYEGLTVAQITLIIEEIIKDKLNNTN